VGAVGAPAGLTVYLNDSTHPLLDRTWGYGANSTVSRTGLEPLDAVSSNASAMGWSSGPALSVVTSLCPTATGAGNGADASCNSYDGPRMNASTFPELLGATSWNATLGEYADPYPTVSMFSASGACSGAPGTAPCRDFSTGGGTGNYPFFSLAGGSGTTGVEFGGRGPSTVADLGGPAQFAPEGNDGAPAVALGVSAVQNGTASTGIDVRARVTAPAGIGPVTLSVYFCAVLATSPTVSTTVATEDPGATNTSTDGNFTATLLFGHSEKGTAFYWIDATTAAGGTVTAGPWAAVVSGGTNTCVDPVPSAPTFGPSNVTAVGGGYLLNFSDSDPGIANYTLWVTPDAAPYVPFARSLTSTGPVVVPLGAGGIAYNLSMTATDVAGLTSVVTPVFTAPVVAAPLSLGTSTPATSDLWIGADTTSVNLTVAGGVAPYTFRIAFGDGSSFSATNGGPYENVSHDFGALNGVAVVRAQVTDAIGLTALAPILGVSVLAGPLGVNQSLSTGAFSVRLAWSVPASPASPVTGYTVFYTNRSSAAPTVSDLWSVNRSAEGAFLWNTTATFLDLPNVQSGQACYALVVAWDALGVGTLPDGWLQTPSALPLNLTYTPLSVTPTGGPAPLTVDVSDTISFGTNGTLVEGLYSFGASGSAPANLDSNLSGGVATWWLNASWTFPATGTEVIVLHASDPFGDAVIPVASVYVGPAAAPSAVARITSGTPLVGQP
ncbi:MAG TPA: hypothetical protein VMH90_06825, partial [Thermoplasmata archaeon]|nr:hypothetical protein [Thermoplasmata archaeon]